MVEISKKFRNLLYHFQDLMIRKGVIHGKKPLKRFVILSRSRTGSNLLLSYLNSHSMVRCYGEVFNFDRSAQAKTQHDDAKADPLRFMEEKIFHPLQPVLKVVGFKLFYYHANEPGLNAIWDHLKKDTDLYVIHLRRENLLRAHISRMIAERSQVWSEWETGQEKKDDRSVPYQVHIDPAACIREISATIEQEKWGRKSFGDRERYIEISYEELTDDPKGTLCKVLRFMELPQETLQAFTKKQNDQPISELVSNYEELEGELKKEGWEDYLKENRCFGRYPF